MLSNMNVDDRMAHMKSLATERLKKLNISEALSNFSKRTGMHAVSTITSEKTVVKRCGWSMLFITALVMLGIQVHGITFRLFSRPTSTKVVVEKPYDEMFPAVTFCNLNAVKRDIIDYIAENGSQSFREMFGQHGEEYQKAVLALRNPKDASMATSTRRLLPLIINYYAQNLKGTGETFRYSFWEMVLHCEYETKDCTIPFLFEKFFSPRFGNCFVFDLKRFFSRATGAAHQFTIDRTTFIELILSVDTSSYTPQLAPGVGYVILIHPHTSPPIPDEEGYLVAPGFLTQFGLKKSENRRLPPPYGKCDSKVSKEDNLKKNMFFRVFNHTEPSKEVCMRTCEQLQVMRKCKCYSIFHGHPEEESFKEISREIRKKPCIGEDDDSCVTDETRLIRKGDSPECNKMCSFEECSSTHFQVSQSSAVWPDDATKELLLREFKRGNPHAAWLNSSNFRENVLKVRITFDDLNVIVFKAEPTYVWFDFLSDLGGQGGLWLGISVFTVCEVLVMIFELITLTFRKILLCCRKCRKCVKEEKNGTGIKPNENDEENGKTFDID